MTEGTDSTGSYTVYSPDVGAPRPPWQLSGTGSGRQDGRGRATGRWLSLALLTFALTGCSSLWEVDNAGSNFASVVGNEIDKDLDGETNRTISDPSVGTVAFLTGYKLGPGFLGPSVTISAFSGIAPGYDVGDVVTSGSATYDATYAYEVKHGYEAGFLGLSGRDYSGGGSIDLKANFDAGTLTGADSGLTVDGDISGGKLSGSVEIIYGTGTTPSSLDGTLAGYIGSTGTIGAFHGNDDDTAAAGGFVGTVK